MGKYTDEDGNEITKIQKWLGGFFLILLSISTVLLIIGLWPDRIPKADENFQSYYKIALFHVRLIRIPEKFLDEEGKKWLSLSLQDEFKNLNDSTITVKKTARAENKDSIGKDTPVTDSAKTASKTQSIAKKEADNVRGCPDSILNCNNVLATTRDNRLNDLIHLNTLLLILVGLTGFMGNLIYVATSFTTFLGSGQFKRSWMLWYFVKPFIASSLAIVTYFVLCGGFLTVNNSPNNLNIYGILTIAMLTGLFTDRATLKLKEIFEVLLKPKEDRPDPLVGTPKIESIAPAILSRDGENLITITGENLLKEKLSFVLDDVPIEPKVSQKAATYKFMLSPAQLAKPNLKLVIKNEKGVILEQRELAVPPTNI
ncbi:hypothetical protein EA772_15380 [Pedobacter sp. G11]|uniref:IPT/TIG domain-containing protein n=1 Tax=Pedobacter sp. G11 TaxID=2482728 RepID=UPI000F5E62F6|nr:IPT/TIG domain-containing protein [Pedobacter sp. G11]AZI26655.1 hypothetical protein EA772_15380 [Pedobacter sp. G11]